MKEQKEFLNYMLYEALSVKFTLLTIPLSTVTASANQKEEFTFSIATSAMNAMRCLRALNLSRPLLLEGSPGCGKTSLVAALAKMAGSNLVRINLSEQTVCFFIVLFLSFNFFKSAITFLFRI